MDDYMRHMESLLIDEKEFVENKLYENGEYSFEVDEDPEENISFRYYLEEDGKLRAMLEPGRLEFYDWEFWLHDDDFRQFVDEWKEWRENKEILYWDVSRPELEPRTETRL